MAQAAVYDTVQLKHVLVVMPRHGDTMQLHRDGERLHGLLSDQLVTFDERGNQSRRALTASERAKPWTIPELARSERRSVAWPRAIEKVGRVCKWNDWVFPSY